MRAAVLLLLSMGCGRFGFDKREGVDGLPDAAANTLRVGNRSDCSLKEMQDTHIDDSFPGNNYGVHADVHIETNSLAPTLMRFELAGVTARPIVSAQLHLWVTKNQIEPGTSALAYRMLEGWDEGTSDDAVGAANWTEARTGTSWTIEGAQAPGSREGTAMGASGVGAIPVGGELVIDLSASIVRTWIDTPLSNNGIALFLENPGGDYAEVGSQEWPVEGERPVLVLGLGP